MTVLVMTALLQLAYSVGTSIAAALIVKQMFD